MTTSYGGSSSNTNIVSNSNGYTPGNLASEFAAVASGNSSRLSSRSYIS